MRLLPARCGCRRRSAASPSRCCATTASAATRTCSTSPQARHPRSQTPRGVFSLPRSVAAGAACGGVPLTLVGRRWRGLSGVCSRGKGERARAGPGEQVDCITDVAGIEWAGEDALLFTVPDALGRPHQARPLTVCVWFFLCASLVQASAM